MSDDKAWHHETATILKEIGCMKRAEARHYSDLRDDIKGLRKELLSDLRVHKVKTGFVAGITTTGLIIAAWILSAFKGGV